MRFLISFFIGLLAISSMGCGGRMVIVKNTTPANKIERRVVVTEQNIKQSNLHLAKAKSFYFKGKYQQAQMHCEKAIQFNHANWEAHYYLGLTMQKRREYAASIEALKISLKLGPDNKLIKSEMHFNLAIGFEKMDMIDRAQAEYSQSLAFNSGNQMAKAGLNRLKVKKTKKNVKKSRSKDHDS